MSALRDAIAVLARLTERVERPEPAEPAAARMVLARAEKRLAPMIARRGAADELVLATAARYEREYERATRPVEVLDDDLLAMVRATTDPAEVPRLVVLPSAIGGAS